MNQPSGSDGARTDSRRAQVPFDEWKKALPPERARGSTGRIARPGAPRDAPGDAPPRPSGRTPRPPEIPPTRRVAAPGAPFESAVHERATPGGAKRRSERTSVQNPAPALERDRKSPGVLRDGVAPESPRSRSRRIERATASADGISATSGRHGGQTCRLRFQPARLEIVPFADPALAAATVTSSKAPWTAELAGFPAWDRSARGPWVGWRVVRTLGFIARFAVVVAAALAIASYLGFGL